MRGGVGVQVRGFLLVDIGNKMALSLHRALSITTPATGKIKTRTTIREV